MSKSPLLTRAEACEYLRVSRSFLFELVAQGKLVPVRLNLHFERADLDAFIYASKDAAASPKRRRATSSNSAATMRERLFAGLPDEGQSSKRRRRPPRKS